MEQDTLRSLRPHQWEAVEALCKTLAEAERATAVMACGTGKTRVGAEVAHLLARSGTGRALVVVPTLELISQTMREWADHLGRPALGTVIAVCSDREVLSARRTGLDLADAAVTGDPVRLAQMAGGPGPVTVACTYQSLGILADAHAHGLLRLDIAVVDEAHRSAGAAGKPWALIHDADAIRADRRLYLTATPRIVTGGDDVVSMSDERVYGPIAHRLPFATAIDLGLLARYRVVVAVVTDQEVRNLLTQDDAYLQMGDAAVTAHMLATQLAILRAAHQHAVSRMITFHARIQDAKWFAIFLRHAYTLLPPDERPASLWASYVHGQQTPGHRRDILNKLADGDGRGLTVISNAKVLSEGVDVPAIDGVSFVDPRGTIDTIQAVGRALRRGDPRTPKTASIIVPVLLGPGQDPESGLGSSVFDKVWQTVRALAALDGALASQLDTARRSLANPTTDAELTGTAGDLPDWITFSGVPVPPSFARAVAVRTVRMTTSSWPEYAQAVRSYREQHGDLLVSHNHRTATGLALGMWIKSLRQRYHAGILAADRIQEMDGLGMVWDVADHKLDHFVRELRAFKAEHGHLRIPFDYVVSREGERPYKLGNIAGRMRTKHARDALEPGELEALDAEGFIWNIRTTEWDQLLKDLAAFRDQNGHLLVPHGHTVEGRNVARSVESIRRGSVQVTDQRHAQLDALGFIWESPWEYLWKLNLEALRAFKAEHGHLRVPPSLVVRVGTITLRPNGWLKSRRIEYRRGKLSFHREKQLRDLGVDFNPGRGNGSSSGKRHGRGRNDGPPSGPVPDTGQTPAEKRRGQGE
jgi:superfamily II DNA or RNA helicase